MPPKLFSSSLNEYCFFKGKRECEGLFKVGLLSLAGDVFYFIRVEEADLMLAYIRRAPVAGLLAAAGGAF